ncbi:MAG: ribonuclease H-like domain-containing protein [Planctomycetes bacterium]|nr:ribonuclease H-like domain-containing protein [Planctomycetota bacterium]
MLTASFNFAKGMTEDLERALWGRGILDWELAKAHPEEVSEGVGGSRAGRLAEALAEAQKALAGKDKQWFRSSFNPHESYRLWRGYCAPERIALVDIETTGLTPGYDQITVIGLVDRNRQRVFVAGKPMPGDEPLDRFPAAIKDYDLIVTFNGDNFDLPFIERHFKEQGYRSELPHMDLLVLARDLGISGGLKDIEKQVGIARGGEIAGMRGGEAIALWGAWKNGDAAAYKKITTYCKADCANLWDLAEILYAKRWDKIHTAHAKAIDFAKVKGQQLSIFG